jgi:dephospho-CoA kinase
VLERIEREYKSACRAGNYTLFIVEIPLLFEIGAEKLYDVVIAVIADEKVAKERFASKNEYEQRMSRQWPLQKKSAHADFTIDNNGSLEDLKPQVEQLNAALTGVSHP